MNQAEMENSLRAMLAERAQRAPIDDGLAEQIISSASSGTVRQLHRPTLDRRTARRRSWTLPLLAVAAAAAVVAGTVSLLTLNNNSSGHGVALPGNSTTPSSTTPTSTSPVNPPSPTTTAPPPAGLTGTYLRLDSTEKAGATQVQLKGFRAVDLTFVGSNIWAMGSAMCLKDSDARCSALVHSTDGEHWSMLSSTPFNVEDVNSCSSFCAEHIRFATSKIGYIFGPSLLLMTTDAGRTWKTQRGGAFALETLDGNVIKVSAPDGCPPGCTYTVQTAPVGSSHWKTVSLPGSYNGVGVSLARTSHFAYLMTYGNPAGGAENEKSTLFTSDNDGASWVNRGEVCRQNSGPNGEVDSSAMTGGSDGSIVVACQPRLTTPTGHAWVTVSTNGGRSFHAADGQLPGEYPGVVGAGTAHSFCVDDSVLYCSQNGGASFAKATTGHSGPSAVTWLGFENETDGRALEITGSDMSLSSNLWTTHDGGASWTRTLGIG